MQSAPWQALLSLVLGSAGARLGGAAPVVSAGWLVVALGLLSYSYLFNEGFDPWFQVMHLVGIVGILGTVAAGWSALLARRRRRWWAHRRWAAILVGANLGLLWFALAFRLVSLDVRS
jgi:hypothetical protein